MSPEVKVESAVTMQMPEEFSPKSLEASLMYIETIRTGGLSYKSKKSVPKK
jgi:hypothetical protein